MDGHGRWTYRSDLFPSGLASLSQHLQGNDHRLGLYILPGIPAQAVDCPILGTSTLLSSYTAEQRPGNVFRDLTYMPERYDATLQHYFDTMAQLFGEWGVRYIKIDGCGPGSGDQLSPHLAPDCRQVLLMMGRAFRRHAIWVEVSWYLDPGYVDEWAIIANGARVYIDIESYSTRTMTSTARMLDRFQHVLPWIDANRAVLGHRSGFYLDLDAVLVGMTTPWNGRCIDGLDSDAVRRTYISFWALVSSVFCIGADPRLLPDKYIAMLHHPDVLDIHQSGVVAVPLPFSDPWHFCQVWYKPLDKGVYVGLFNTAYYPLVSLSWLDLEVGFPLADVGVAGNARAKDVWTGQDLGVVHGAYSTRLAPGACQLVLLSPL